MKNIFLKKASAVLLAIVLAFMVTPFRATSASASTYTYDANAAVDFAKTHCESESKLAASSCNNGWLCAEFVANCLSAGGFKISGSTAKVNAKAQGEYMQKYGTKIAGKVTSAAVSDDFVLPLKKGDIVYVVYNDTVSASGHVLLYSGEKNSSGALLFYAHNNRKSKATYTLTGKYLAAATEIYAITLNSAASTTTATATNASEVERINTQIKNTYSKALSLAGKSSFNGWCGACVRWQLVALNIISSSADKDVTGNGNKMYTNTKEGTTSTGYTKKKYAGNSCLTDIINANGGGNVYNIFVSWTHQYNYTNSNPGAGHVTFIHAILDGKVYYVESYKTSSGIKEGQPQSCTVAEFMKKNNNSYGNAIGAVHFTSGSSGGSGSSNTSTNAAANPDIYPVIDRDLVYKKGSSVKTGDDVKWVQAVLNHLGYSLEIDGSYGPSSSSVIKQFQQKYGLTADSMCGPDTRAKLKAVWASQGHSWDGGTVTQAATHAAAGVKTYKCTCCGATKTESIAAENHSFGGWAQLNEAQHQRVCACGATEIGDHTWDGGIITQAATHAAAGVKTYRCTLCGATKTENVPAESHSFGGWAQLNEAQHQRVCACGATEIGDHTWDGGTVTQAATHMAEGVKTYKCTLCGATKTEAVAKLTDHTYGEWQSFNTAQHKRVCECGAYELANHEWNEGLITTPPTKKADGVKTYECTQCKVTKTEVIPMLMPAENSAIICISEGGSAAGASVKLNVAVKNNPGVSSLILKIEYDETLLTLTAVEYNEEIGGQTVVPQELKSPLTLYWINAFENMSSDVVFATLTFKINDGAEVGARSDVTVSYNENDVYNVSEQNVKLVTVNGSVTVRDYLPADVNGDGELNNKDVTRLMQYFAGFDVDINEAALDINGDGVLNNKDVSRLMQYLAGYKVDIY